MRSFCHSLNLMAKCFYCGNIICSCKFLLLQSNYDPQGIWLGTFKSRSKYWVINTCIFLPCEVMLFLIFVVIICCIELLMQIVTSRLFWYVVFLLSPRGCYILKSSIYWIVKYAVIISCLCCCPRAILKYQAMAIY